MKKCPICICSGIAIWLLAYLLGCGGGGGDNAETYSVSGTILATNNSVIDSDVNDILADYVSNDTIADAQTIPNPAILGGYINISEKGEVGRSYDNGDLKDFYSVTLTTNQTITLYIADFPDSQLDIDIDLYLYDEDKVMVDSSIGIDSTETVSSLESGDYFIEVRAESGASNYILVIGQPIIAGTILDPRLDEDFMPGHVIVAFQGESSALQSGSKMLSQATYRGMSHKDMAHGSIRLYQFTDDDKHKVFHELDISPSESKRALYQSNDPDEQSKLDTLRVIDALKNDPNVRFAEPNYFRYPLFVPNDPYYSKQWHYPLINLPQAWEVTEGDSNVVVAVIDTGILSQHPDIIGQLTTDGYDFISVDSIANDTDPGRDDDPEDTGEEMTGGSSFHGTHVSGTIAAASNNAIGVAGIAYQSKIMPLRALGPAGGLTTDVMEAMKYAAGLDNKSNTLPDKPANIINMSIGGGSPSQAEQTIIDDVRAAGIIIIAAAGNEDTSDPSYPAAYTGVVSVSAVGPDKSLASYSNYGATIDVAAPGGDFAASSDGVYSTSGDNSQSDATEYVYSYSRGTSMASPHMAGVVALMKSVQPALTPTDLDGLISAGTITEDLGADGADVRNNSFGYGLIDAFKAVEAVSGPLPAYLLVDSVSLNFGNITTQKTVSLTKSNNDALTVNKVVVDADWLTVTADASVDAEGIGDYLVAVDRTDIVDGPYYTTITFESTQNSVDVLVIMYQGPVSVVGDTGFHYVLLLDAKTFRSMHQDNVAVSNGEYAYYFPSVTEGNYIVFAGTDSDNDLYIGDSGEATGAYISLDQPAVIGVNRDLSNIDFNTTFNINISADHLPTEFSSKSGFRRWVAE